MVMHYKTHAALVHYHKCTRPWSCSPSISNTGTLSQLLRLQYRYHECEKQWSCTTRLMQRWFIITTVQNYGHVARDPRKLVHNHECTKPWPCSPRPHNAGTLLQVTVLIVWNGELKIALCIWPCAHEALWWHCDSLQRLHQIVAMGWNCNLSHRWYIITTS